MGLYKEVLQMVLEAKKKKEEEEDLQIDPEEEVADPEEGDLDIDAETDKADEGGDDETEPEVDTEDIPDESADPGEEMPVEEPPAEDPAMAQDPNMDPNMAGQDPNMMDPNMANPMADPDKPVDAEEVGRIFELKKIYARLLSIESYLSTSSDIILLKLRKYISEAIELFQTLIANHKIYKPQLDEIIVQYYTFLENVYMILSAYYKIKDKEKKEKENKGKRKSKKKTKGDKK